MVRLRCTWTAPDRLASDDTYNSGDIGLFAWTGNDAPAEIHYDDLVVTEP
jgi:hypothetical protein